MTSTFSLARQQSGPTRARTHRAPVDRVGHRAGRATSTAYARRRALVGGASAVLAALTVLVGVEAVHSDAPHVNAEVSRPTQGGSVVARQGDTLWSIAEAHRGGVGVRRYLDALIDLNGGPSILAGQRVLLP